MSGAALRPVALATGVTLDVWDCGPREAPALVFLHGFPESHRTWRHQIAHLSGRYRCIAPDQRGYGGSSKPAAVDAYAPRLLVADVFALADALGIERFTVIGHDWGGAIAWPVALLGEGNGRVPRAVIANAPHPTIFQRLLWTDPAQRAASQYINRFRDPSIDRLVRRAGLAPVLRLAFGESDLFGGIEPAEMAALAARWADGDAAMAMLEWYRASPILVPPPEAPLEPPADLPKPLPPLGIPLLLLWGEEDAALLPANASGLEGLAPAARLVRLPRAGHFSPWQAPDAVNAALDAFLAETG